MAEAANIIALKNNNRYRILDCLRRTPMSRVQLSREVGLTKAAVTIITNELISEGIVFERGLEGRSNKRGRTSILLDIAADYGYSVGVMLHRKHIDITVIDLKGNLISAKHNDIECFSSADRAIDWAEETINKMIKANKLLKSRMIGIGVGCPGPVEYDKGNVLEPPNFKIFNNYPVVEKFKERFSVPVYLENNAVVLALAEHYKTAERSNNSSLFVVISYGIGATALKDGKVFRGSRGFSGELGHTSIDVNGIPCSCGNCGCLEKYATMAALMQRHGFQDYSSVIDLAIKGDAASSKIINDLVKCLGAALVNATNLYDLDEIILFGEYSHRCDYLCELLQHYIINHSVVCQTHSLMVRPSTLTDDEAVASSAISALNAFYKQNLEMRF